MKLHKNVRSVDIIWKTRRYFCGGSSRAKVTTVCHTYVNYSGQRSRKALIERCKNLFRFCSLWCRGDGV